VNDHRQITLARKTQLDAEHLVLHITRRQVVVIVETDLTNGTRRRNQIETVGGEAGGALRAVSEFVRVVGMHPDREPHLRPGPLNAFRLFDLRIVVGRQDHQTTDQASCARASDNGIEVRRELGTGQVAVGVNHVRRRSLRCRLQS
jgi:hypothetical protein